MAGEAQEELNEFAFPLSAIAAPIVFFPESEDKSQKPGYLILATGSLSPYGIEASYNLGKQEGKATIPQIKTYLETHTTALLVLAAADHPMIRETGIDSAETRLSLATFVEPTISRCKLRRFGIKAKIIPGTPTEMDELQMKIVALNGFQTRLLAPASPGNSPAARR